MKKVLCLTLVLLLACALFACKPADNSEPDNAGGDDSANLTVIKVGASPTPHAELLELVVDDMEALGYDLQIYEYTDYVQPNTAVDDGSLDANFFQHLDYLNWFNEEHGTDLTAVAAIHYEPYGVYPGKDKSVTIDTVPDGATVALPNDSSNEARALLLLESLGLITLEEGAGLTATILSIAENPKNLNFIEIEPAQLVRSLEDVDLAVINGNYAIQGGLSLSQDAVAVEDKDSPAVEVYANYLVVRTGNESSEGIQALVQCLQSEEVRNYIASTFTDGSVVAKF